MVKHIVMWNLKDKETAAATAAEMKRRLEALVGVVPGLRCAQVGHGFAGFDVALVTELADQAALAVYQDHPAHVEVKQFVQQVVCERAFCDFEF